MWNQGEASDLAQQLIAWRRHFHAHPEISREEKQTAQTISEALSKMGIEVRTFAGHFGVCGMIQGKHPGPVVVFRADMDALPITEANDVPYRSRNPGVMHACGHDGHMAIVLGVAKLFSSCRDSFAGTIKILFQPAEEASPSGGARQVMEEGVLDDADVIFGLHLWPDLPCGQIGVRPGPLMAASDRFTIKIIGKGAHAGQPQNGVDSITIASDVIHGLGHIMNRQLDPLETATLSVGKIQGGERYNVIARETVIEGTVRTLGEDVRRQIPSKLERLLEGTSAAHGGSYILDYQYGYPVLSNWKEPTEIVLRAARQAIGGEAVHSEIKPVLAAEDFGNYLAKIPGAYFWLGCAKEGQTQYGLHNPNFGIDEAVLLAGVRLMYQIGCTALLHYSRNRPEATGGDRGMQSAAGAKTAKFG
jgi:amidohydrolase